MLSTVLAAPKRAEGVMDEEEDDEVEEEEEKGWRWVQVPCVRSVERLSSH